MYCAGKGVVTYTSVTEFRVLKGGSDLFYFYLLIYLFLIILFYFIAFLAAWHGMRDLSSPTRDRTHAPCIGSTES